MTVKELFGIFKDFKENEFDHLLDRVDRTAGRVDKIYFLIVTVLIGILTTLVVLFLK